MNILKIVGILVAIGVIVFAVLQFSPAVSDETQTQPQGQNKLTEAGIKRPTDGAEKPVGQVDRSNAASGDGKHTAGGESKNAAPGDSKSSTQNAAGRQAAGGRPGGSTGRPRSTLIVSAPASEAVINDRLSAVGSGTAVSSVSVVPLSAGTLVEVLVKPGQLVQQGDVLARLDDEEQVLARDRAARTTQNAITNEQRLAKLFRSRTASAADLDNAKAIRADADLALRESELKLQRRNITAPISGVVGLIAVDSGNYVTAQTELVTIDDRSTIIVQFWIPERFANQIAIGQSVDATALANPGKVYKGVISGIDSRIETNSRTLPVEARLDNASDSLRPGMSFELELAFAGQMFAAVNPLAVQWDSKGSFVWRVVDDKAQRTPVSIIQRNPESVLVDGDIAADDQIVIEGLLSLRPGAAVRVQSAGS